jgi:hypothetical protein
MTTSPVRKHNVYALYFYFLVLMCLIPEILSYFSSPVEGEGKKIDGMNF